MELQRVINPPPPLPSQGPVERRGSVIIFPLITLIAAEVPEMSPDDSRRAGPLGVDLEGLVGGFYLPNLFLMRPLGRLADCLAEGGWLGWGSSMGVVLCVRTV